MRTAYALLGIGFLAIFGAGAFFISQKAEAPAHPIISKEKNTMSLTLASPAFEHGGPIPEKYTCDGEDIYPPFDISGVPDGTQSLALIMEDPDVPKEVRADRMWDHWVIFNMPAMTATISENMPAEGMHGTNTNGSYDYRGPCPPDGEHRYFFKLYALDADVPLEEGATKDQVLDAMTGHILEEAELMGTYKRVR